MSSSGISFDRDKEALFSVLFVSETAQCRVYTRRFPLHHSLREFISDKAQRSGVAVEFVAVDLSAETVTVRRVGEVAP